MTFPAVTGLKAQYFGNSGGATATSYYVQAIYPGGRSPVAGPATLTIPATLDSNNEVLITWEPAPGAIGYDVLKNLTGTVPAGLVTALLVAARTANSYTDTGRALVATNVTANDLNLQTATDTATLTSAQMLGNPCVLTGTPTGAAAYTTPTAAILLLAMQGAVIGSSSYILIIRNTSGGANTITLTAGSNVTITGTATIAQNITRTYLIIPATATTVTILEVSSGAV